VILRMFSVQLLVGKMRDFEDIVSVKLLCFGRCRILRILFLWNFCFGVVGVFQLWIQDAAMSTRVKDSTGSPAFALINKATGQALRHAHEDNEQVLLAEYEMGFRDETILWSQSEDMGDGYRCIRMVNKITSNLDALQGDKKSGGIKDGTPVILFKWKKQENQIWKLTPA
jgi:hypothetical protein